MKIDAHLHVNYGKINKINLIDYLDKSKTDRCWLLTWDEIKPTYEELYEDLNVNMVLEAYNKYPERIIPFYAPDPNRKNWKNAITKYIDKGFKGIGELKSTCTWSDDNITRILDFADKNNMPIVFHMERENDHFFINKSNPVNIFLDKILNGALNGLTRKYAEIFINKTGLFKKSFNKRLKHFPGYMLDFAGLETRLKQYPGVNFIAHGPEFWNNIEKNPDPYKITGTGKVKTKGIAVELMEEYNNLYADTSGKSGFYALKRDSRFTRDFLNDLNHKILFGTDNETRYPFEKIIRNAGLSSNKLKKIMGENALSLIK